MQEVKAAQGKSPRVLARALLEQRVKGERGKSRRVLVPAVRKVQEAPAARKVLACVAAPAAAAWPTCWNVYRRFRSTN